MTIHFQRSSAQAALLLAAAMSLAPALTQAQSRGRGATASPTKPNIVIPKIRYTDFTLPNGLRVLVHEDHSSPVVAVEVWYNAGSKFDPKGRTGLAHMFEHMMDEGTANMPAPIFKEAIQSVGGYYNAATGNDHVRYWSTVSSNNFETVLWLEAERMANLSPALDSARFMLEREAIRNEIRQILSDPTQVAASVVPEHLFPGGAYAPPIFGFSADIDRWTLADARSFYETHYVPNNAVLVIAGDVTAADARRKVEKHFGPIPRGKAVVFPKSVTPFQGEKRLVVEHPANARGIWSAWRGAGSGSPDRPAMMALSSILTQRLTTILVVDRRLAILMNPRWNQSYDLQEAGIFQVAMTPNATAPGTVFEQILDSVVASIKQDGVTAKEVERWVAGYRLQMLTQMQSDSSKANNLGDATINMKRPLGIYELTERALLVTPAQVQAAARKYLTSDRVIVSIIPVGKFDLITRPDLPYVNVKR
jgi:zinc protease